MVLCVDGIDFLHQRFVPPPFEGPGQPGVDDIWHRRVIPQPAAQREAAAVVMCRSKMTGAIKVSTSILTEECRWRNLLCSASSAGLPPFLPPNQDAAGSGQPLKSSPPGGSGVIWKAIPFETRVIPAKAGIHSVGGAFPMVGAVDSRLRGITASGSARVPQMTPLPARAAGCAILGTRNHRNL